MSSFSNLFKIVAVFCELLPNIGIFSHFVLNCVTLYYYIHVDQTLLLCYQLAVISANSDEVN